MARTGVRYACTHATLDAHDPNARRRRRAELVAKGADVNVKDSCNGTGLIRAAERGYATIVARLLENDIDVDHVNRLGWTALLEAAILGEGGREHIETVGLLVEAGADVNIPDENGTAALAHARRRGFTEIERILRAAQ